MRGVTVAEPTRAVGEAGQPAFANSWVNFGSGYDPAGFFKDADGLVHLHGLVKDGTIGQAIFTLPAGYRPAGYRLFAVTANFAYAACQVQSDGIVQAVNGSNAFFALDGIVFRPA